MPDPQATPERLRVIAQSIEAWMRSDGFAHRHAYAIWGGEDLVPLKAVDCAHFVELAIRAAKEPVGPAIAAKLNDPAITEAAQNAAIDVVSVLTEAGIREGIADDTIALMACDATMAYLRGVL